MKIKDFTIIGCTWLNSYRKDPLLPELISHLLCWCTSASSFYSNYLHYVTLVFTSWPCVDYLTVWRVNTWESVDIHIQGAAVQKQFSNAQPPHLHTASVSDFYGFNSLRFVEVMQSDLTVHPVSSIDDFSWDCKSLMFYILFYDFLILYYNKYRNTELSHCTIVPMCSC